MNFLGEGWEVSGCGGRGGRLVGLAGGGARVSVIFLLWIQIIKKYFFFRFFWRGGGGGVGGGVEKWRVLNPNLKYIKKIVGGGGGREGVGVGEGGLE